MSAPAGRPRAAGLAPHTEGLPAPRRGLPPPLTREQVERFVRPALDEDRGGGDLTSFHAVPEKARARARLVSRSAGVLAGSALFARTFELCDPRARVELSVEDGARIAPGQELARVEGAARALLTAERTALNFVQRLSGIATLTARFVERAAQGGPARVLDTRKTTPNLRLLEKYAVRCGGGENHRSGLYDEVLVKENHIELAGRPIPELLRAMRQALGPRVRIGCEARDEAEARAGIEGGADVVLLDNMSPAQLLELCPRLREQARALGRELELEASGRIDLENVSAFSASGVDRLSVGALTHSAPALDLALDLEPLA